MQQLLTPTEPVKASGKRFLLLLIDPYPEDNPYRMVDKEQRTIWFPKLSLPVIASRTPGNWDVRMIDESRTIVREPLIEQIVRERGRENVLVGISTQMTCYTPRAYEIATLCRAKGLKVCLGGTHATYCTEEAQHYADSIIRFEADEIWPEVIRDFEQNTLKSLYEMQYYPELENNYPHPRIDLLPHGCYMTNQCLQTTRGCHFDCEFCSVSPFNGKSSRRRSVDDVINEIQRIKEWRSNQLLEGMIKGPMWTRVTKGLRILTGVETGRIFAFVDDLHNSNRDYCKKLWTALKALDIKWGAQCTLFLGNEPDMVKLAAESGCVAMFVGMESINEDTLMEMNKPFNQENRYEDQIKCFHDHGIMVNPGIIFGNDHDDESVFENTVEFLIKCKVELAYINIVTPLPGTVLFERMKRDGRIFDWNWSNYDGKHVVFRPKLMTPETLQEGFYWANRQFFSIPSIMKRVLGTQQRLIPRWIMNWRFRGLVRRTTPKTTLSSVGNLLLDLATEKKDGILENIAHARVQMERRLKKQLININIEISLLQAEGERVPKFFAKLRGLVRDGNAINKEMVKVRNTLTKQMNQHRIPALISYAELNFKEKKAYMQNFVEKLKRSKTVKVEYTENPDEIYLRPCA